ncbi:MAG: helix-turn-helix transcriptional regulator [Chloroflexota bacterium]
MDERQIYPLQGRLNQLNERFKRTLERVEQVPTDRDPKVIIVEEQMRASILVAARNRVSQSLKQLREAHNLSYGDLQAKTGLSQQLLWEVEYKERRLTLTELKALASCYQLSAGDILGVDLE